MAHRNIWERSRGSSQAASKGAAIRPGQHFPQGTAVGADGEQDAACLGEPRQRLPLTPQEQPLGGVLQGDGYLARCACIRPQVASLCLQDVILHNELQRTAQLFVRCPSHGTDLHKAVDVAVPLHKFDDKGGSEGQKHEAALILMCREVVCQIEDYKQQAAIIQNALSLLAVDRLF